MINFLKGTTPFTKTRDDEYNVFASNHVADYAIIYSVKVVGKLEGSDYREIEMNCENLCGDFACDMLIERRSSIRIPGSQRGLLIATLNGLFFAVFDSALKIPLSMVAYCKKNKSDLENTLLLHESKKVWVSHYTKIQEGHALEL